MSNSPYSALPPYAFWRSGVAQQSPLNPQRLYAKKFEINPATPIMTAGSCFAQHISRYLKARDYAIQDIEPAPEYLPLSAHARYGYGLYSARYGNIYTMRQMLQLAQEAFGLFQPGEVVWEKEGRYYDALRPSVEPEGLGSPDEVNLHRRHHVQRVHELLLSAELIVFTLGLTEAWEHKDSGTVFPTVPGSIAGQFNAGQYQFRNFHYAEILADFIAFRELIHTHQSAERKARFLLTVSPVPLTATYSGQHVLVATTHSKSVLRAVAGQLFIEYEDVDYYPSFEIINNCWSRGIFYENNMRSVSREGVETAMRIFLDEHAAQSAKAEQETTPKEDDSDYGRFEDVVCEEALLAEFAK